MPAQFMAFLWTLNAFGTFLCSTQRLHIPKGSSSSPRNPRPGYPTPFLFVDSHLYGVCPPAGAHPSHLIQLPVKPPVGSISSLLWNLHCPGCTQAIAHGGTGDKLLSCSCLPPGCLLCRKAHLMSYGPGKLASAPPEQTRFSARNTLTT